MIQEKMKKTQDHQKIYEDHQRRSLEFEERDHVLLKITPRLRLKVPFMSQKLSPGYVEPYQIIGRIGEVTYRLELPPSLSGLHDLFHVSQLRRFIPETLRPILLDIIEVEVNIYFQHLVELYIMRLSH